MVQGKLVEPPTAAVASIDPAAWAMMDAPSKTAAFGAWTDKVLLAFTDPDEKIPTQPKPTKSGVPVTRSYLRRDEPMWTTAHATGTWVFGPDGALVGQPAETVDQKYRSEEFTRPERVTGVTNDVVIKGLETRGAVIKECFTKAWDADLDYAGRVVLEWKISGGKTEGVKLVDMAGDPPPNRDLANCQANAVNNITWAEGVQGSGVWVFAIIRDKVTATN
jgi:hypothetical protein